MPAQEKPGKPAEVKPPKLTELQAAFVREYVVDFVAGRAWQRAQAACGRKVSSAAVADQMGCDALRTPKVREACNAARDSKAYDGDDMRQRLLDEFVAIAFSDVRGIAKWVVESCPDCWANDEEVQMAIHIDRKPYPVSINKSCQMCRGRGIGHVRFTDASQYTHGEARLYDGMEYNPETGAVKVRVRSRDKALEMLARHFGIGPERVEVTGKDGGPIEITGARERLLATLNRRAPT